MITIIKRISKTGRVELRNQLDKVLYSLPGDVTITKSTKESDSFVLTHRTLIPNFKEGLEVKFSNITNLWDDTVPIAVPADINTLIELLSEDFFLVINPKIDANETRIIVLEDQLLKVTYYENITGASGSITIPTGGTILFDQFGGVVDAIVSEIDASNTPTYVSAKDALGNIISVTSIDIAGNYVLTGIPVSTVSILYVYSIARKNFDYIKALGFETTDVLNELGDVETDLPITPSIADDGRLLHYDTTTKKWISDDSVNHGTVVLNGKKDSAGTLEKGLPVYLVDFDDDLHTVELADASSSITMPIIGFTAEQFDNINSKHIIAFGKIQGIDTTSTVSTRNPYGETWIIKQILFAAKSPGGLTKVRPSGNGTIGIQRIAKVLTISSTGGQLLIFNTARTAGLPNIPEGNIWIGDSDAYPQEALLNASLIPVSSIGTPTYNDLQAIINTLFSAGVISGGNVIDNEDGTVDAFFGTGLIRATDSTIAQLFSFNWQNSLNIAILDGTTRFIGVEYNIGTPQIAVRTTNNWNNNTDFGLATATREGLKIHVTPHKRFVNDIIAKLHERTHGIDHVRRDENQGGLKIGETGTRNITITAGSIWVMFNKYPFIAKDTSGSDTFDMYVGATKDASDITQWDNLNYNNAGTKTTLGVAKYANVWLYADSDNEFVGLYGNGEYNTFANAVTEGKPTTLPLRLQNHSLLLGRFIFQQGDSVTSDIRSEFDNPALGISAASHNDFAGLNDGDYIHLTTIEKTRFDEIAAALVGNLELDIVSAWVPSGAGATAISFINNELIFQVTGTGANQLEYWFAALTVPDDYKSGGSIFITKRRDGPVDSSLFSAWVNNVADSTITNVNVLPTADLTFEDQVLTFGDTIASGDTINFEFATTVDNNERFQIKNTVFKYNK